MYKPKLTPLSVHKPLTAKSLPKTFTLLVWNLQKVNFSHFIFRPIEELINISTPHILSLQEAATHPMQTRFFNFPFVMAPNIQTKQNHYGVITASGHRIQPYQQCLTRTRELGLTTYKTALVTHHPLANGQTLTHVNIHAINFVSTRTFKKELNFLWNLISDQTGPMIISGDFNTWNKTRLKHLYKVTETLNLKAVQFPDNRPIKTLLRQPLDHIFYRQLTFKNALALSVPKISDHNPLIATFCTSKNT